MTTPDLSHLDDVHEPSDLELLGEMSDQFDAATQEVADLEARIAELESERAALLAYLAHVPTQNVPVANVLSLLGRNPRRDS